MKFLILVNSLLLSTSLFAFGTSYPTGPDLKLTPGKLCDKPTAYRYPEHVAYCDRDVTYETKEALIKTYDTQLGFNIESMNRADFKIDHLIPLCAGGSNDTVNLWPQYKNVYEVTDPVEPLICDKMAAGRLSQADAVKFVLRAKMDLTQVPAVLKQLNSL